jgi:hypothetical protein
MTYGWPLRPFDRAHPVRAYLNDPRIEDASHAFHFGIDISAPNGTPVFAVEPGTVHLQSGRSVAIAGSDGEFGYWHVVPTVAHLERVERHHLLGHVESPWLHVHFAERRGGLYRNPLRPGALTPWTDETPPHVTRIVFQRGTHELKPNAVSGAVDVIAEAHDEPPVPVPPPWDGLPVAPARLRWRVLSGSRVVRPWRTPVDLAETMLEQSEFHRIYAPGTRQNHAGKPGLYRYFLAHTWSTRLLADGSYRLEVEASDVAGNTTRRALAFAVANEV